MNTTLDLTTFPAIPPSRHNPDGRPTRLRDLVWDVARRIQAEPTTYKQELYCTTSFDPESNEICATAFCVAGHGGILIGFPYSSALQNGDSWGVCVADIFERRLHPAFRSVRSPYTYENAMRNLTSGEAIDRLVGGEETATTLTPQEYAVAGVIHCLQWVKDSPGTAELEIDYNMVDAAIATATTDTEE